MLLDLATQVPQEFCRLAHAFDIAEDRGPPRRLLQVLGEAFDQPGLADSARRQHQDASALAQMEQERVALVGSIEHRGLRII